jgi:hypothetical protein
MENNCVELVQNQLLQEEDGATSSTPVELEEKMGDLDLESNSLMHIRNINRNVDNTNRNRIQERTMSQLQPLYDHVGMLQQLNHVYQLPKLPSSFGHVEQLTPIVLSSHVYQLPQLPPGCGLSGAVGMIKSLHPPQPPLPARSMAAVGTMGILQTPMGQAPRFVYDESPFSNHRRQPALWPLWVRWGSFRLRNHCRQAALSRLWV